MGSDRIDRSEDWVHSGKFRKWVRQAERDSGTRPELTTEERERLKALWRENKEVLWGSMIKQTMKRKRPSFNESTYGYGSFSELLEEARRQGIITLKRDERSGSYVVTGFAKRGRP